jgi:hypothetical protein
MVQAPCDLPPCPPPSSLQPDALAQDALSVYLTPDACEDLRRACLEFLAALPKMGVQGVAGITAALPPLMRAAPLPPEQLAPELDALLHSGSTLMLQVRFALGAGPWEHAPAACRARLSAQLQLSCAQGRPCVCGPTPCC